MSSPLTTNDLHRIFRELNKSCDGILSIEELNWLLQRIGVELRLDELESSVGKSSLNFDEFLKFWDSITKPVGQESSDHIVEEESDLAEAFRVFDINGDGLISREELEIVLTRLGLWDEASGKDCRSMISVYDTNSDGFLDFEEFKRMMMFQEYSPSS